MDIVRLYNDYNIDYRTEGHKHCREGWVNVECPFCSGNPGYHLGFPIGGTHFVCWRCGPHKLNETISRLLSIDYKATAKVITEYDGQSYIRPAIVNLIKKKFKFPTGTTELQSNHIKYLQKRNFDPQYIAKHWELQGTGPVSFLDETDYSHRILIPIYWNGTIVSFQCRDITGKQEQRYLACPKNREQIEHKHIVYVHPENWEKMKNGTGICVEGVTDVWKLGDNALATFGIKYKKEQVRVISQHLKRVAVMFDDDPQAIIQAEKLVAELKFRGLDAFRVPIIGDPGSMTDKEAAYLVKQIL